VGDAGYPDPPDQLHDRDVWLVWKYDEREKSDGSTYQTKVPLDPDTGREGDATDDGITVPFERAVEAEQALDAADGIGFAILANDLLVGTDLDDVRDPEDGSLNRLGREVMTTLDSYTEVSPSGTGLHAVALGFKPGDRCRRKLAPDGSRDGDECEVEMYDEDRFFTYTGQRVDGAGFDAVEQRNDAVSEVYEEYLANESTDGSDGESGEYDGETPDLDLDDEQVLEKARNASNGEKFERLERGSDSAHGGDTSAADQAFVNYLAFYTGGDRSQMDRLFRASGRMRDKWDPSNHSTYKERTLDKAINGREEFYEPEQNNPTPDTATDGDEPKDWVRTAWSEHAETIADPAGPGELGEAVEQTIDVLVAAHANGMARPTVDMWLKELSDQSDKAYTKSGLADLFDRRMDAAVADGATGEDGSVAPRVPEFMENHLQRVVVNRVTDHNVDTSYQWHFNGDLDVVFSTTGGTHWDWYQFRERYFDETGVDLREPADGSAEDWRAFVVELIDERGEESKIRGPRTETIGALKNYIERRTAYGNIDAAAMREGVYLDGEDADGLWVLSKDIQRLCAERDVSTRGLQEELRARGLTTGSRVAERRRSSGTRVTWWRLSADIADPRTFEDGDEIAAQNDDSDTDSDGDAEEHE
jgi:putative DNA primase/helicase